MDNQDLSVLSLGRGPVSWLVSAWHTLHFSALLLVVAASPSTYTPETRRRLATGIWITCRQTVPPFTLLSALLSIVLVHIVVVTAQSYGLSQFALGTVVRVLVVELLPLSAALYVALRTTGLVNTEMLALREAHPANMARSIPIDPVQRIVLPQVAGSGVAVVLLATISGGLALLFAYLGVYGFTPWGITNFTRTVGQVFNPVVVMALALKTMLFAIAVATIPASSGLNDHKIDHDRSVTALHGSVRLFIVLIVIEVFSLAIEFL